MKRFLKHISLFFIIAFIFSECVSRLWIDDYYFKSINTYKSKGKTNQKPDLLFIGSSRVTATVNPALIMQIQPNTVAINAARGYSTPGIHYQAIKQNLKHNPNYLKQTKVFLELPGTDIYSSNFKTEQLRFFESDTETSMPQLLLPYLDLESLSTFLQKSPNSFSSKLNMVFMYVFSSYRTLPFIKEKTQRKLERWFSKKKKSKLINTGGIKNNTYKAAKQKAVILANQQLKDSLHIKRLTIADLNQSVLKKLQNLITKNGGELILFKIPLHSLQDKINHTSIKKTNKTLFNKWLETNKIPVLQQKEFYYTDKDFPDTWHLSKQRRDEFTVLLLDEIKHL